MFPQYSDKIEPTTEPPLTPDPASVETVELSQQPSPDHRSNQTPIVETVFNDPSSHSAESVPPDITPTVMFPWYSDENEPALDPPPTPGTASVDSIFNEIEPEPPPKPTPPSIATEDTSVCSDFSDEGMSCIHAVDFTPADIHSSPVSSDIYADDSSDVSASPCVCEVNGESAC